MEFNEKTGQPVLIRHRAWPDNPTDQQPYLHATGSFYPLVLLLSHACSSPNYSDTSLSPPFIPLVNIPQYIHTASPGGL